TKGRAAGPSPIVGIGVGLSGLKTLSHHTGRCWSVFHVNSRSVMSAIVFAASGMARLLGMKMGMGWGSRCGPQVGAGTELDGRQGNVEVGDLFDDPRELRDGNRRRFALLAQGLPRRAPCLLEELADAKANVDQADARAIDGGVHGHAPIPSRASSAWARSAA